MLAFKTFTRKLTALMRAEERATDSALSEMAERSQSQPPRQQTCPSCGGVLTTSLTSCPSCLDRYGSSALLKTQSNLLRTRFVSM